MGSVSCVFFRRGHVPPNKGEGEARQLASTQRAVLLHALVLVPLLELHLLLPLDRDVRLVLRADGRLQGPGGVLHRLENGKRNRSVGRGREELDKAKDLEPMAGLEPPLDSLRPCLRHQRCLGHVHRLPEGMKEDEPQVCVEDPGLGASEGLRWWVWWWWWWWWWWCG